MTNDDLNGILQGYGIHQPVITFLRHNENRTYKVDDANGSSYVLRIHQPLKDSMAGLQHTYEGLLGELQMLEELSRCSSFKVQKPLRTHEGKFIMVIDYEGESLNCSMLTWLEGRDLHKDDVANPELVKKLGLQLAELHAFFKNYSQDGLEKRPSQGIAYNQHMNSVIKGGVDKGLFTSSDVSIIENTIKLINSRLEENGNTADSWGLIHGDLGLGNIIITSDQETSFIDFGFFGSGYYLLDVAMGAMMIPAEYRRMFLEGYYGSSVIEEDDIVILEGFMLVAIIGYYVFQMENESVYAWMKERMPLLCANYCSPFLAEERIFYKI
ncbi:phosphotransferase [Paenibacillus sp. HJL G12]|uniref:Phosphotransferase n=1 Tax=Paenibacillus dendrobii TaxID=2691084 RepID=A0A7X3IFV7_9BACL|nr:aminoglycoside phosphotransferase family protein [Paenibacillus dendrobii]MWV42808.1 phosphotransferase [Paenibacillus dendrobii]